MFERNLELELKPLELRATIGLTVIFASLCLVSCGSVLFFGSARMHVHGEIGYIGLALILGGSTVFALTVRLLQPHKAVKHASHRVRYHARKLRPSGVETGPAITDAEVDAIEDAFDERS